MRISVLLIIFGLALPSLMSYICYYGYMTNYTYNLYNPKSFQAQYEEGIYKYRVVGRELVSWSYQLLDQHRDRGAAPSILNLDPKGENNFYHAYFLVNTFFAILASCVLVLIITDKRCVGLTFPEIPTWLFTIVSAMMLTQYVVTPYDTLGYFFQLMGIWLALHFIRTSSTVLFVLLIATIVLSTLNRETSAITVAFSSILIVYKWGIHKVSIMHVVLLVLVWSFTYMGLRVFLGWEDAIYGYIFIQHNLTSFRNLLGLGFMGVLCALAYYSAHTKKTHQRLVFYFHLCILPYLVMCIFVGVLFETRLYIPVFLGSMVLGKLNCSLLQKG